MKINMMTAVLGISGAVVGAGLTVTHESARRGTHISAYPTRCVLVTLPPDGRPLPEVCIVYPL